VRGGDLLAEFVVYLLVYTVGLLVGWTARTYLTRAHQWGPPHRKAMGARIPKPDLSLPAKVYRVNRYRYPHKSEQDAMRGDWEKIGGDFRVSIAKAERETAE
jgi:hypothetical protein